MASRDEFARILKGLAMLYPRFKLEPATLEAYYRILGDVPGEILDAAALEIGRSNTFFPSASELRKAAFGLQRKSEGVPNAQDGWAEVSRSFGSHGYYRGSPEWSHPLIGLAIDAVGGYAALCQSENPAADRARFMQAFDAYLDREIDLTEMLPQVREMLPRLSVGGNGRLHLNPGDKDAR